MCLKHWIYIVPLRLRSLFRRTQVEQELDEELHYHIERQIEENIAKGTTKEDARYAALRAMGGVERRKEECRDMRRVRWIEDLTQDVRYSLRTLRKSPGFTAVAALTLALGIGANTAIFSVVYATLFEPMGYPNPDQLVMVWSKTPDGRNLVSAGDYLDWKQRSKSFQQMGAWIGAAYNIATRERPEQVDGVAETPGFLTMQGIRMLLGRDFLPEEGEIGHEHVVILSHRLWNQHFGADDQIIGKELRINGESYTVVGVAPPGLPDRMPFQLWVPLVFRPDQINHDTRFILVMGRLKDGVSIAQAQAEMNGIARQLAIEYPMSNKNWGISVEPLHLNFLPDTTRRNLWLALASVGFLLLICCINIANLQLARGTMRRREVALRAALGASRIRIFGQFLTESILIAVAGGLLGVFFAENILSVIVAALPQNMLPSEADVRISLPVLGVTLLITLLAGILFGTAPAWEAARLDLIEAIKLGGRTGGGSIRGRWRQALIVAEIALALTLLTAGGLTLRSFWNLTRVDLGLQTEHVIAFALPVSDGKLTGAGVINSYYRQILEKAESTPGVEGASISTGVPVQGPAFGTYFSIVGKSAVDPAARPAAGFQMVTPGYHGTLGILVSKGRSFDERDTANSQRVAMVNENFVKRFFPGVDPLTQRIAIPEYIPGAMKIGQPIEWQIVGVFHNVRSGDLREDYPEINVPFWQGPWPQAVVVVKTGGDPEKMIKNIARAVNSVDPDLPIAGVKTLNQIVSESLALDRLGVVLFGSFAVSGLLLAAVGIYGVMAFTVLQRTQEFGLRMALGAQPRDVLNLVIRQGVKLVIVGLVIGTGGALALTRLMRPLLFNVGAVNPLMLAGVAALFCAVALLACWIPARRATKVDPMAALRSE